MVPNLLYVVVFSGVEEDSLHVEISFLIRKTTLEEQGMDEDCTIHELVLITDCEKAVNSAYNPHIVPCDINGSASLQTNTCALVGVSNVGDVPTSCRILVSVVTQLETLWEFSNRSMYDLQNVLLMGVELSFYRFHCRECEAKGQCCHTNFVSSYDCRPPGKIF
ncbi:hypothetical protein L1049_015442 [Liquidambar formosana]|uniref:Uncharacterized protein n=1 Tax=Liquidambar formosana TaxID=63359 RepID=A0AAP0WZR9_LIQFO